MSVFVPAASGFLVGVVVTVAGAVTWNYFSDNQTGARLDYTEVLEAVEDPIAHLDGDTIVFANSAFAEYADGNPDGATIDDALSAYPELKSQILSGTKAVVTLDRGDETACYNVTTVPITAENGGRLALFYDVTAERERREQLEAQNEQLDRFASLISHDLRNPLDVAIGRTNAIRKLNEKPELDDHLASTQDALQRMKSIITDVLALARKGEDIGETMPVSLTESTEQAWNTVETEEATLERELDAVITANPEALAHIFENLFRNAIQHAGEDTTITVGRLEDDTGFYVADDGPGIPEQERDRLLEAGESDAQNGTGLGLAIVESITTAHGWKLTVTDAESGGARFEFSGVEFEEGAVPTEI
jgi:signal transduction histidine kinase